MAACWVLGRKHSLYLQALSRHWDKGFLTHVSEVNGCKNEFLKFEERSQWSRRNELESTIPSNSLFSDFSVNVCVTFFCTSATAHSPSMSCQVRGVLPCDAVEAAVTSVWAAAEVQEQAICSFKWPSSWERGREKILMLGIQLESYSLVG